MGRKGSSSYIGQHHQVSKEDSRDSLLTGADHRIETRRVQVKSKPRSVSSWMAIQPFSYRPQPNTSRIISVNMDYPTGGGGQPSDSGAEEAGIDMELMHNFGEGVGVDMRDFTVQGDEDVEGVGEVVGVTLGDVTRPKSGERGVFTLRR